MRNFHGILRKKRINACRLSSTMVLLSRRWCTLSIPPRRLSRVARFSGRISRFVSKRPIHRDVPRATKLSNALLRDELW